MTRRYDMVEHTADLSFQLFGSTLAELFICAAEAMFSQLSNEPVIDRTTTLSVAVEGQDLESLLVNWLNELLYLHETRREVYGHFQILALSPHQLKARVAAQPQHSAPMMIKAATYHGLAITESASGYEATVVFDV